MTRRALQVSIQKLKDQVDALPSIREATISAVSPLTVRYDTDTTGTVVHGTLVGSLGIGNRVLTLRLARYVWVLGRRGGFPYGKAQGRVQITPSAANTPTGVSVTFPVGRFTVAPRLQVTAATAVPGTVVTGVGYSGTTSAGTTVYVTRTDTTTTPVDWSAEQMLAGSADG